MQVSVRYPHDEVGRFATALFNDQVPFATSLALNNVAKAFQTKQRDRLREIFTIRKKAFADRSIKIGTFATKRSPEVRVAVDSPGGRSDIFGKFEDETSKSPFDGGNSIAIPTEHVPRNPSGTVKKAWRPRQVLARNFRGGFRAFVRRKGNKGTIFFVEGEKIVPLYQLVPRVRIEPDLQFIDTANQVVSDRWQGEFVSAFDRATLTARRR